jgi:hypothetical protein
VQTAEALPILLERIKNEGYQVVTVSQLLNSVQETDHLRH